MTHKNSKAFEKKLSITRTKVFTLSLNPNNKVYLNKISKAINPPHRVWTALRFMQVPQFV